jgi:hypothetical protein
MYVHMHVWMDGWMLVCLFVCSFTCSGRSIATFLHMLGGSLLLADGGVCIIDNLSSLKKDTRETLQKGTCMSVAEILGSRGPIHLDTPRPPPPFFEMQL